MHANSDWLTRPLRLDCPVKHYDWGERGADAFIPNLLGLTPESGRPYAELWIGAHPTAPAKIVETGEALDKAIGRNPEAMLGGRVAGRFGRTLPFLLKVLTAAEPLSIQAHPDKAQAERLHRRDPVHYPDENHKPEIAVALDSLDALAGFRSMDEIEQSFSRHPELKTLLVGSSDDDESGPLSWVQRLSQATDEPGELDAILNAMTDRVERTIEPDYGETLFLELRKRYPGPDIGLIFIFLLDRIRLAAGEGVFIGPGVPHAYLRGRIVECMANSDNVVRAGLTPKFKDLQTLTEILRPEPSPKIFRPGSEVTVYPQCEAFRLRRIQLEAGRIIGVNNRDSLSILLVVDGECRIKWTDDSDRLSRGCCLFIPASLGRFEITAETPTIVFTADVPEDIPE